MSGIKKQSMADTLKDLETSSNELMKIAENIKWVGQATELYLVAKNISAQHTRLEEIRDSFVGLV